ncbi:hypothetical protein C8Q80DRAFT_1100695, partial [Daedaleopsis nitida]
MGAEEYDHDKYTAISVWDELSEWFEREVQTSGACTTFRVSVVLGFKFGHTVDDITSDDLSHLRPFALKVDTYMTGTTFAKLQFAFPESHVETWKCIQSRVAQLSGIQPVLYDCCPNSCMCFVGPHATLSTCTHCNEGRYRADGTPRSRFLYIPFTPRLKALFSNRTAGQRMLYRAREHISKPGIISDVMDSTHYHTLCQSKVRVDDKDLPHQYFDDPRDVALGLSTDGFAPHRRRKKT